MDRQKTENIQQNNEGEQSQRTDLLQDLLLSYDNQDNVALVKE